MKPLIVILLLAISAQAQTLADEARKERERQARLRPSRVITNAPPASSLPTAPEVAVKPDAGAKPEPGAKPVVGAKPEEAAKTEEGKAADAKAADAKAATTTAGEKPAASTAKPAAAAPPKPPLGPDPVALYNAELDRLRARIRQLQDQEVALQLQVNQLTNQIYAPVVDPLAKDQAQNRLGATQQQLTSVRSELEQTRSSLNSMQLQGPPKAP